MVYLIMTLIIPLAIFILSYTLNLKTIMNREKSSPFECGFDPSSSSRLPFSLRFFLLAVLFLVFDIEIVLILPLPIILNYSNSSLFFTSIIIFIIILILGLLHEWNEGSLDWSS